MNTFVRYLCLSFLSLSIACGAAPDNPTPTPEPEKPRPVVQTPVVPPHSQYPEPPKGLVSPDPTQKLRSELALHVLYLVTGTVTDASVFDSCESLRFTIQMLPRLWTSSAEQARLVVGFRRYDLSKDWSKSFVRLFTEVGVDRGDIVDRTDLTFEGKNCTEKTSELRIQPAPK